MAREDPVSKQTHNLDIAIWDKDDGNEEWDAFVEGHPGGHHAQTSLWALVKKSIGWRGMRLAVREHGRVIAGAQLLLHPIPVLGNIGYVIKGPLCPPADPGLERILLNHVLTVASQNRCFQIVIQPSNDATDFCGVLQEMGFRASIHSPEHASTLILDLSAGMERIKAGLKRQTYQSIRRSEREGIQVRECSYADLNTFICLHEATSARQEFAPYPLRYFETLWRVFQPIGHLALLQAEYQGEPVSSLLLICFRDTVLAYILGWSGSYSNLRPNHALFWSAIQWAERSGYRYFDFGGVDVSGAQAILAGGTLPESLQHSPDFLKYGFGGEVRLYPPAYDMVPNRLVNWSYQQLPQQIGKHSTLERSFNELRRVLMKS